MLNFMLNFMMVAAMILVVMAIIWFVVGFCVFFGDDVHDIFENIAHKRELKKRGKKK